MSNGNTQFSSHCVRFFRAFYVTDKCVMTRLLTVAVSHICSSFSVHLRHKSYVIIPIPSLVESQVLD